MNSKSIVSGAFILFAGSLLSSLLGLAREVLSAAYYGASVDMDAYLFANTLPAIALAFFGGILMGGFIPLFIKKQAISIKAASELFSNTMNWVIVIVLSLTAILYLFSHPIADYFSTDADTARMIERLLWILLPSILFFGLSYAQSAVLNSLNHFLVPAFLTVLNNIVVIGFIIAFHHTLGIDAVAYGFVTGTILQVIVQWPVMRRKGIRYKLHLTWRDEDLKRLFAMSLPIIGLVVIDQCVILAMRLFAAYLQPGSAAALNYAGRFIMLPVSLFGTALISATYPSVVSMLAAGNQEGYNKLVTTSLKSLTLILAPIMLTCVLFAPSIIALLLERGAFDAKATEMTASAFAILAGGILFIPIRDFYTKLFYSRENMRVPIWTAVLYLAVFIGCCLALVPWIGFQGIAVSSISALVVSLGYMIIRYRRLEGGGHIGILPSFFAKIGLSSLLSAAIAYGFYQGCIRLTMMQPWKGLLSIIAMSLSMFIYILLIRLQRISEIEFVYDKLANKFKLRGRRSRSAAGEA